MSNINERRSLENDLELIYDENKMQIVVNKTISNKVKRQTANPEVGHGDSKLGCPAHSDVTFPPDVE